MTRMIPPSGMKSLAVETPKGTKVLHASKDGTFNVNNPKLIKKLKQEGLGVAGIGGPRYVITACNGHESTSKTSQTCKKCWRKRTTCGNLINKEGKLYNAGMVGAISIDEYSECGNLLVPCDCDLEK